MSKLKAKLKTKLKPKPKPTYDAAEVKPLTEKELGNLNREVILEMYRKQRFGKLKALQVEITDRTSDEKGDLRDLIVDNARERLKKLDSEKKLRINVEDGVAEAQAFADAITGIEDEDGALMKVLKHQEHRKQEQDLFLKTLDANVGSKTMSKRLKKMIKNNKWAASMLALIREKNPKAMDDINIAINKGDYDELKKAIVKADGNVSEKQVDYIFAAALTNSMGEKSYTGNKTIDGLITRVKNLRYIGHTYSMKKAAKAADVSFWFVMRFGQETLSSLRSMDDRLQTHKHLIENKKKFTQKDHQRIHFIDAINKMRKTYDAKVGSHGLEYRFEKLLKEHLDKKFDDPKFIKKHPNVDKERLKAEIIANAKLEQLKLYQIFDLTYGSDEERSRLFFHGMTRGSAIAYQFYRNLAVEEDRHLRRAFLGYFTKRVKNREIWKFRSNAKKWGLNEIVKDLDDLEVSAKKAGVSLDDIADDTKKYKINSQGKNISVQELYDRDMLFKKYHVLARRASEIMTEQAKPTFQAGGVLDEIKASKARRGLDFMTETANNMTFKPGTLEAIYGKGKVPSDLSKVTGKELVGAYGNKLVDLKTMQDVTQARFKGLAESIEANVETAFDKKMRGQLQGIDEQKFRNRVSNKLDDIATTSKVKKYGKRMIIPAIILGFAGHQTYTGQMKTREVFWNLSEAGLGFVPVVGTALDFKAAFSGKNLAGKKLSTKEQVVSFGFGVVGAVADALTVVGGSGLALRGAVGGMRGTRTALKSGKAMGHLADAGHLAGKGPLSRIGGWFGNRYNAASRLERATNSTLAAKATEQANHISDINHELKGIEGIDNSKPLNSELDRVQEAIKDLPVGAKKTKLQTKVTRLREMQRGIKKPGASYLTAFKEASGGGMSVATKSDWRVIRWMQEASMWSLEKWRKGRAVLKRVVGVNKKALDEYEKGFEAIKDAEKARVAKMDDIAGIKSAKDIAEKDFKALQKLKETGRLDPSKSKLIDKMEEERRLLAEKKKLEAAMEAKKREVKTLKSENLAHRKVLFPLYKEMKGTFKSPTNYEKFVKMVEDGSLVKHVKGLENQNKAIKAVAIGEQTGAAKKAVVNMGKISRRNKELKGFNDDIVKKGKEIKKNNTEMDKLGDKVAKSDQKWHDDAKNANDAIKNADANMSAAQKALRTENAKLNKLAGEQFRMQTEMSMKAERFMHRYDAMRKLSKTMQYTGMAMGAIWFLSDWKYDPLDQAKLAGRVAKAGGKAAGAVGHQLYFADHSGKGSIDSYIEGKIHALDQTSKMEGILAKAKEEGRSEEEVLAEHSNTVGAQEIIRKRGLTAKVAGILKRDGAARREIVTGDAASKLREANG